MFVEYADKIRNLAPEGPTPEELLQNFLLEGGARTRIYHAPFDWINTTARIVIVGITPGEHSMRNAFRRAAASLRDEETLTEASKQGKRAGSFSNMRFIIAEMFDELGVPEAVGIERSEDLFSTRYDLLHPTSCVRYPVFIWNKRKEKWVNYTGHSPKLLKWDTSVRYIEGLLADELRQIPGALIVPCGKAVDEALHHLSARKVIDPDRCLFGFPHASGANGWRKRFFCDRKQQLKQKVAEWRILYSKS